MNWAGILQVSFYPLETVKGAFLEILFDTGEENLFNESFLKFMIF